MDSDFGSESFERSTFSTLSRNSTNSYVRDATCAAPSSQAWSFFSSSWNCSRTIAQQLPLGVTTYSYGSKISMNRCANGWASSWKPLLKNGCPQHVWACGNETWQPKCSRIFVTATATCG